MKILIDMNLPPKLAALLTNLGVESVLLQNETDLNNGAIMTIDTKKSRVRLLPLD